MRKNASDIETALKGGTLPSTDSSKGNTTGLVKVANRTDGKDTDPGIYTYSHHRVPPIDFPAVLLEDKKTKKAKK